MEIHSFFELGHVRSSRVSQTGLLVGSCQQVPPEQRVGLLPLAILYFPLPSQVPPHCPKDFLPGLIQPVLLTGKGPCMILPPGVIPGSQEVIDVAQGVP